MTKKKKILFLQLEIILNCPPHMGMCLFVDDLHKNDIECDTYIVNAEYIDDIITLIEKEKYTLICLDSIFTVDIINHLQSHFPHIPILVGGVNALSLLIRTNIQYAIFGPGRTAINAFFHQYFGPRDFYNVPNLFFKNGKHIIYSDKTQGWNLEKELFPYHPFLNWRYIGPSRISDANFTDISIIAGTGCPYANSTESSHHFAIRDTIHKLGYDISQVTLVRLEEIYNRKRHGCSFCIFQYQEHTSFPVAKTIELLLKQALYLYKAHNITSFQVQTENPLPLLYDLIITFLENGIAFHKLSIRTRPDLLLLHKNKLLKCLDIVESKDLCLSIEQIGFESFHENDLKVFNKNINVNKNLDALRLLREIKEKYGKHVVIDVGHGIILFHPWTTLESLTENLRLIAQYRDVFPRLFLGSLILYSEFLPIYPKIMGEDLYKKSEYWYGLEYKIKDPLANKAFELYRILLSHFGGDIPIQEYLRSIELIGNNTIDDILRQVFYLVAVDEGQ
jgi:hypothetical protein